MANTYLTRTPSSAGNRKTYTWSSWVKRSGLGATLQGLFTVDIGSVEHVLASFLPDDTFRAYINAPPNYDTQETTQVFRDTSSWYHILVAVDTTQSTASDRLKLYVNGLQITSFDATGYPLQNADTEFNTTNPHYIGFYANQVGSAGYFDGYMAEVHFIDGTAYTPTTFGETNTDGVWVPKVGPSVTYGTNGFYLKFENSGAMGTDSSGNSNTFSVGGGTVRQVPDSPTNVFATLNPNNISGGSLIDGNLYYSNGASWSNGVTGTQSFSGGKWYWEVKLGGTYSFIGIQDVDSEQSADTANGAYKWTYNSNTGNTHNNNTYTSYGDPYSNGEIVGVAYDADNGTLTFYNEGVSQGTAFSSLDTSKRYAPFVNAYGSNLTLNFGQNGTFNGTETAQGNADGNGKGDFYYTPPTGFLALCTANLSSALTIPINKGADNFNTVLYTGNGGTQSITGVGFQPDWLWIKSRNFTDYNALFDSNRGSTKRLFTNVTEAENTQTAGVTSFDNDGFSLGSNLGQNRNTSNLVAWNWKAGTSAPANTYAVKVVSDSGNKYRFDDYGTSAITLELQEGGTFTFDQSDASNSGHPIRFSTTADGTHGGGSEYTTGVTTNGTPGQSGAYTRITVAASAPTLYYYCSVHSGMGGQANTRSLFGFTNVKGSIQSVVSPNITAGFSVVTYTGTGANATVGHGLGKAPNLVIVKLRSGTGSWAVYSRAVGATKVAYLENTAAFFVNSSFWNNTDPTSSVFSIGSEATVNTSSGTLVAYCFADIEGYSKIGTYTGNGSTDGTFVYTGFRPAWLMIKRTDSAGENWTVFDNKRDGFNVENDMLKANNSETEDDAGNFFDLLSNGFKARESAARHNASGGTYLYMAFAENPFVSSGGTPVTAR